jgi:hypothetical protein
LGLSNHISTSKNKFSVDPHSKLWGIRGKLPGVYAGEVCPTGHTADLHAATGGAGSGHHSSPMQAEILVPASKTTFFSML